MASLKPYRLKLDIRDPLEEISSNEDLPALKPKLGDFLKNFFLKKYLKTASKENIKELVSELGIPSNSFILNTDGRFHHFTYGLVQNTNEEKIGYIHIDNHHDSGDREEKNPEKVSFANFVPDIHRLENVEDVLLIGSSYIPFKSLSSEDLRKDSWENDFRKKLGGFPEKVYLSIDLDFLNPIFMETSYDQGASSWRVLEKLIEIIYNEKDVVAGDIVGLEKPVKDHEKQTYLITAQTLLNKVEEDQRQRYLDNMKERKKTLSNKEIHYSERLNL